jgi:hypothetical protein
MFRGFVLFESFEAGVCVLPAQMVEVSAADVSRRLDGGWVAGRGESKSYCN